MDSKKDRKPGWLTKAEWTKNAIALTAARFTKNEDKHRDSKRRPIVADNTLRVADARPHAIQLDDLSPDGCRIDTASALCELRLNTPPPASKGCCAYFPAR